MAISWAAGSVASSHWAAKLAAVPASVSDPTERAKQAWTAFSADPSGTGPFKGVKLSPRERFEMVANKVYWDPGACSDRLRRAGAAAGGGRPHRSPALGPDRLDRVAIARRRAADQAARLHRLHQRPAACLAWQFSFAEGSPWVDIKVRHAANLSVNREELMTLLGGLMEIPKGTLPPGHPWWGNPKSDIKYDLGAAKALMTQAGYSAAKPAKVKVLTSASGSGQLQPLPMNEFMQQALKDCLFDVVIEVGEWSAVFTNRREDAKHANARRQRHQRHLRGDGPVLRHGALHLDQDLSAGLQQPGLFRQ